LGSSTQKCKSLLPLDIAVLETSHHPLSSFPVEMDPANAIDDWKYINIAVGNRD